MTDEEAEHVIDRLWAGARLRLRTDLEPHVGGFGGDYDWLEIWRVGDGFDEQRGRHYEDVTMPQPLQRWHWTARDQVRASLIELDYATVIAAIGAGHGTAGRSARQTDE